MALKEDNKKEKNIKENTTKVTKSNKTKKTVSFQKELNILKSVFKKK
jgi:hypothetical protein